MKFGTPFLVKVANFSDQIATLQRNERVASSHPVPIPAPAAETDMAPSQCNISEDCPQREEMEEPMRRVWDQIGAISFEGEDEIVPGSTEVDPETR